MFSDKNPQSMDDDLESLRSARSSAPAPKDASENKASFLQQSGTDQPQAAGKSAPPPASAIPTTTGQQKPVKGKKHIVQPGENLSKIAHQYYGNDAQWIVIYNANKAVIGDNPNVIRAGMELVIPKI